MMKFAIRLLKRLESLLQSLSRGLDGASKMLESKTKHLVIELDPVTARGIERLRGDSGTSLTELMQRVFSTFDILQNHVADGGQVVLRNANGSEDIIPPDRFYKWATGEK